MKARISDRFAITSDIVGIDHAPGVVVIVDAADLAGCLPRVGAKMTLHSSGGQARSVIVGETKSHGAGISLFFANLSTLDVPIGSELEWQEARTAAHTH